MNGKLDTAIVRAVGYKTENIDCPHYSTDGNAMLLLDKEMRARRWLVCITEYEEFVEVEYATCPPMKKRVVITGLHTEPFARALAAYKALTGREWNNGNN